MTELNNCDLPDELLYHVEFNEWLRDEKDGTFTLGMTDIAQAMAGTVIHCRIKKAGKPVKSGKSLATVESGKWVGPVKAPFACSILEKNEAVEARAGLLNESPYQDGWIARVKPDDPESALADLAQGDAAVEGFRAYMIEHEFDCCGPKP